MQLTEQWDKAALAVGSLGDKFKAVSNEIQLEGQNLGEHLAENFKTAVDDMSGQLAKFIVTGKGSIREFFDSLAENALKSTFQYSFSKLFAGITGAAGPGGAPGGVGPGGTAGTFPGPLGGVAGALGLKLPGAPGDGAHAPSSVATMNIAAQVVNLSGSPALGRCGRKFHGRSGWLFMHRPGIRSSRIPPAILTAWAMLSRSPSEASALHGLAAIYRGR